MKIVSIVILVILVFLAISSGTTKIMLMEQEVNFFIGNGFTRSTLMAFGFVQVLGGLLMVFAKTRFAGSAIVAVTFLVSLVILISVGNFPVSIVTAVAIALLGMVMKQSWRTT